ncbi:acetylcholine-gated cation-selective channel [Mactra antiquata]
MTVMTLNIHHKGHRGHRVPRLLKSICFGIFSKLFCMQMEAPQHSGNYHTKTVMNQLSDHGPFNGCRIRPDGSISTCNGFGPQQHVNQGQSHRTFTQSTPEKETTSGTENFEQFFTRVLTKVNSSIEMNEKRIEENDEREKIKLEWQHVARVIDRILLTIFVVVTLTTTCAIMFQAE